MVCLKLCLCKCRKLITNKLIIIRKNLKGFTFNTRSSGVCFVGGARSLTPPHTEVLLWTEGLFSLRLLQWRPLVNSNVVSVHFHLLFPSRNSCIHK